MADQGHKLTDERLEELEKRLHDEYEQAAKDLQKKLDKYMKKFTTKDAIWKKSVEAGIRTQEEYDKWRLQAIAGGKRWEKMKARIVADQLHTNQIAREIIDREMPGIFELNANFALYQVEHDAQIDTGLTLYNREAVDRILRDDPEMLLPPGRRVSKQIQEGKAERWERQKVQSVMTQGILQGESIPKLASRLASAVADSDYKAAVRNARTMATNAQNAGRYDAYNRLESNGVELTLEWAATLDNRTRHEHRMMHGQRRNVGEPFEVSGVKIMYPAQTGSFMSIENAPQELIWNCRCTILAFVKGYEHDTITHSDKMGKMTFEEWLEAKPKPQDILHQAQRGDQIEQEYINEYRKMSKEADEILKNRSTVVNGKDISTTWKRRKDQFDFEIEDVINAQGFDGKPRVMSRAEFEEAVKAANGGNGFIAQRVYSAPDQETLDAYRQQLYDGKWYVDCSTGGAQYGQGMYCAADYHGVLSDGIQSEMKHYQDQYMAALGHDMTPEEWLKNAESMLAKYKLDKSKYAEIAKAYLEEEDSLFAELTNELSDAKRDKLYDELYELPHRKLYNYVETMTLDPSAKIITYDEAMKLRGDAISKARDEYYAFKADEEVASRTKKYINSLDMSETQKKVLMSNYHLESYAESTSELLGSLTDKEKAEVIGVAKGDSISKIKKEVKEEEKRLEDKYRNGLPNMDVGAYAAALGYDAIDASGHGASGSYTVILNRTKVIFLRED